MWSDLIIIGLVVLSGHCESRVFVKLQESERNEEDISIPCHQKHVSSCVKAEVDIAALAGDEIQVPGDVTLQIHKRTPFSATFRSVDGSEGVFAWDESDNIAGHVQSSGQTFSLESCGTRCYVWITMDGLWDEEQEIPLPFNASQTKPRVKSDEDQDTTTVVTFSVMVWYTPEFRALFSDEGAMNVFVDLIFAETNQGYENSNIPVKAELHCLKAHPTLHDIENSSDMISAFYQSMSISSLKGSADAASLLVADFSSCGVAYTHTTPSCFTLSVVQKSCATGYYSFGHEIGHNFGAKHNAEKYDASALSSHPYEYGHGYLIQPPATSKWGGYRTILAYSADHHKARVNYYSSPGVNFPATNTPTGALPYADNAKMITDNRFAMSSCGDESVSCDGGAATTSGPETTWGPTRTAGPIRETTAEPTTGTTWGTTSTAKPPPSKPCKKNKKCSKKKGKCYGKKDTIPTNAKYLGYCNKKAGCKCYRAAPTPKPKKCKLSKACKKKKGKCYGNNDTVPSALIDLGYCSKKAGCKCYGPKPKCKPNKKCKNKGGTCLGKYDTVPSGATLKGYCNKKAGCKCYVSTSG